MDIAIQPFSIIAKIAERVVFGPSAVNKAEINRTQQVAQCERCPDSGYPKSAVILAQAS